MIVQRSQSRSPLALRREGFTLLEILVVVAIIVILAGVATFAYTRYIDDAKVDTAKQSMKVLENAAKNFTLKNGQVPPPSLASLIQPPDGGRPFVEGGEAALIDPWGKPYQYDGSHSTNGVDPDPLVWTTNPSTGQPIYALGRVK
jgi:general secretion pathway protein G